MLNFHHYGLEVRDVVKACQFYQSILGFSESERIEFEGELCIFLKLGAFHLEIVQNPAISSVLETVHFCFESECLNAIMEKMESAGYMAEEGPYLLKNGWKTVFYQGPAGEIIEFLEHQSHNSAKIYSKFV